MRAPGFAGVILAAGESSRMGSDKALLPWPPVPRSPAGDELSLSGDTFLSAAIRSLALTTDFIAVVTGKNAASLAPIIYANGASMVLNPDPRRGQFSSLQVGLQEVLNRGRDAAIITLIDRPPVNTSTVKVLRDTFAACGDEIWAIIPEFGGKHGHPMVIGREMIEEFLRAGAESSARDLLGGLRERVRYVAVDDPFVALNINTPLEYEELRLRK